MRRLIMHSEAKTANFSRKLGGFPVFLCAWVFNNKWCFKPIAHLVHQKISEKCSIILQILKSKFKTQIEKQKRQIKELIEFTN